MNSNGMGERFKEEYYKEMENVKKEEEIINHAYNNKPPPQTFNVNLQQN